MPVRKVVQIAAAEGESGVGLGVVLFALADDGSVWRIDMPGPRDEPEAWKRLPELPAAPKCGANADRRGDHLVCGRAAGHAGRHEDEGIGEF